MSSKAEVGDAGGRARARASRAPIRARREASSGLSSTSPHRRELTDLVGELAVGSDAFRTRWAAHKVRSYGRGSKRFNHPIVGAIELNFEVLEVPDAGLTIFGYVAEAGSRSEQQLQLLADWTAPQHTDEFPSAAAEHEVP